MSVFYHSLVTYIFKGKSPEEAPLASMSSLASFFFRFGKEKSLKVKEIHALTLYLIYQITFCDGLKSK